MELLVTPETEIWMSREHQKSKEEKEEEEEGEELHLLPQDYHAQRMSS